MDLKNAVVLITGGSSGIGKALGVKLAAAGYNVSLIARRANLLEGAGLVKLKTAGRRKAPSVVVKRIVIEIDPYSSRDRLRVA